MVQFPISSLVSSEATALFRKELALCQVGQGDRVLILSDPSTNPNYVAACLGAALSLGAEAAQIVVPVVDEQSVHMPPGERPLLYQHILELVQKVEFVADLTSRGFLHSEKQLEMLSYGTRMLRIREPLEALRRLFPTQENKIRVERSARVLSDGTRFRVSSNVGTDLTVERGLTPVFKQYGFADERGRWDHWPTALVAVAPDEVTAQGTIVLAPGDFSGNRYVYDVTRITVGNGRITSVEGGIDAVLIREYLARGQGTDADRISHIGWGCDPRARWDALDRYIAYHQGGAEMRSVYGGIVIAFGSNADLGGRNRTQLHLDLGLRYSRFEIDGRVVLDGHQFTIRELR
jgi:2,5-dihydroxypyridine 5,6-dioxygenase